MSLIIFMFLLRLAGVLATLEREGGMQLLCSIHLEIRE